MHNSILNTIFTCKPNGTILYVSSTCIELLEYTQEELLGLSLQDFIHPEDRYLVESFFHIPETKECTGRLKTKKGPFVWTQFSISKIYNRDYKIVEIIIDTKIMLPKLQVEQPTIKCDSVFNDVNIKNHSIYELIEEAPFGVMINKFGKIQYMNKETQSLLHIGDRKDWIGQTVLQFIDEEYQDVVRSRIELIQQGKNVGVNEQKWKSVENKELFLEVKATRVTLGNESYEYVVLMDISSRKQFQEVLQMSRERYRRLVQNSIDTIGVIVEDEWAFINDSGVTSFGAKSYSDIVGQSIFDFLHVDDHEAIKKKIEFVLQENKEIGLSETKWHRLNDTIMHAEMVAIPVTFQLKKGVQVIIRDISERKEAEKLMLESEKLSIAGQLAAGIAHEIRNPLTSIKGFIQLMKSGAVEKQQYYEIISAELNRIEIILSELLMLAKPHSRAFNEGDIIQILNDVIFLLETQANLHSVSISLEYGQLNETIIVCDETQLKQVFINLIKNSIEAMPNGGNVHIKVSDRGMNQIQITFKDTGIGMPPSLLNKIGSPFVTTKENGTGLGLMVSFNIIKNHKGNVNIVSSENKGTTFTIELPRS
ncbi:PAS domain-containing protein [Bacillus salitolerans]|uniref:histidine kinase n=1 Tax=Bacillus salitolerans TaxID=1437434 RepID=A0ABW4LM98_9BACI